MSNQIILKKLFLGNQTEVLSAKSTFLLRNFLLENPLRTKQQLFSHRTASNGLDIAFRRSNLLFGNRKCSQPIFLVLAKRRFFDKETTTTTATMIYDQSRSYIRSGPGYTKFAHGRPNVKLSKFAYFWYSLLFTGFLFVTFFDFERMLFDGREPEEKLRDMKIRTTNKPQAKEISKNGGDGGEEVNRRAAEANESDEVSENDEEKGQHISLKSKKSKLTFRDRKIIEYENRIRQYSTPDKVFRYFATIKIWNPTLNDYEAYMTPDDFVRSFTYGIKQPDGLGLDSFNKFDPNMQKLEIKLDELSIFRCLGQDGLISFSDFIFLTTLLSTPIRHFQIAFHMFDLDGNGNIDHEEFAELQAIIRNQTSIGQRHRDTRMTGSVLKGNKNLNEYFFGQDNNELLTVDKFINFQKKLQSEVMRKEFELCKQRVNAEGAQVISELAFCEIILAYAGLGNSKTKKMLKNVAKIYHGDENGKHHGISFKDYESFFEILRSIHDIDTALKFYSIAGAPIDKKILKHVSKTVAGVDLSDHVINVIFDLFDENGDNKLSHKEFISVMKKRSTRGLQLPKDTGFVKFMSALTTCTKETVLGNS